MKRIPWMACAVVLVLMGPSVAAATPCGGVPAAGCCDQTTLKYCRADGTLGSVNCGYRQDGICAWDFGFDDNTDGHYECDISTNPNGVVMTDPSGAVPRDCAALQGACIPDCVGKQCGDDGCGGTCGTCTSGTCTNNVCWPTGKFCGDPELPPFTGCCDGPTYRYCSSSSYVPFSTNCDIYGNDSHCGVSTGGARGCFQAEFFSATLPDCANGCTRSCTGKECGDDGCGGSCGFCPSGEGCVNGLCEPPTCTPACGRGQTCTFDGCEYQACITPRTTTAFSVTPTVTKSGSLAMWGPALYYSTARGGASFPIDAFPSLRQGAAQILVGGTHVVALDNNGDVYEWGPNSVFGCGGPWTSLPSDRRPMLAVSGWRCGFIGLHGTGNVVVWGDGDYGLMQAAYADAITDAVAVAAGANFLVLREDGTVSMFTAPDSPADVHDFYYRYAGTPEGDALWDSTNNRFVSYVRALPGIAGATAIAAFRQHYLVVNGNGSIVEWGSAWDYRARSPSEITSNTMQIVAGEGFSLALLRSGALSLWIEDPKNPRQLGLLSHVPARHDFVAVAPGHDPAALTADGTVVMWNRYGPIPMPADVGFVSNFALSRDQSGEYVAAATTRCFQACSPICNATTCQQDGCGGLCPNCGGCDPSVATCACVPQCEGKACGDDSCGGSCGTCGAGSICTTGGQCACVPQCTGKTCGPNGCGGLCGVCSEPDVCTPQGTCACVPACDGRTCGDDGCGGTCGTCGTGESCNRDGQCECVPSCNGKSCGDDGCGGSCGYCGDGQRCTASGTCECAPACTNALVCLEGAGCSYKPRICGSDGCGGVCGTCPTGESCYADGTACGCVGSCADKECGDDGCGTSCGLPDCSPGNECVGGQCVCKPACRQLPNGVNGCGSDGCGGTCGTCPSGTACAVFADSTTGEGVCQCAPNCSGRECGPDGCGGRCGVDLAATLMAFGGCYETYGPGYQCNAAGQCQCSPDCSGKQCGSDGCGGSCGKCRADQKCSDDNDWPTPNSLSGAGRCLCKPNCDGRECGSDGCGGTCGSCTNGLFCDNQSGQCHEDLCADLPAANCCTPRGDLVTCDESQHKLVVEQCGANRWACGWGQVTQEYYCGGGGVADPSGNNPIACPADLCIPNCLNKQCGPDGCGGTCGDGCEAGAICDNGFCGYPCQPQCTGKECGPDGCGGTCGGCASGESCAGGQCCTPQCSGKECGSDGCGGVCGTCDEGYACNATGTCEQMPCGGFPRTAGCCLPTNVAVWCDRTTNRVQQMQCGSGSNCGWDTIRKDRYTCFDSGFRSDPSGTHPYLCPSDTCVPNCFGRNCGDNGCGGSCGTCSNGESCSGNGTCYTPPPPCDCTGKCAADGCTGTCPACTGGEVCLLAHQYEARPISSSGYTQQVDLYGTCVEPCQGIAPVVGCCAAPNLLRGGQPLGGGRDAVWTCPSATTASRNDVVETRCAEGEQCGWSTAAGSFTCGGTDTPPSGVEMFCPGACSCEGRECGDDGCGNSCGTCGGTLSCWERSGTCFQCVPNCERRPTPDYPQGDGSRIKVCGDDGCGGTCGVGTCPGEETCSADEYYGGNTTIRRHGGLCLPPASCGTVTVAGTCSGDTAQYCTAYGIEEVDCTQTGQHCRDGRCVTGTATATAHVCAASDCGTTNTAWACQCDADCATRHDCCSNYEAACGMSTSVGSCGDGTCLRVAGEDCLTCAQDCGACPAIPATASTVVAPYARSLESAGLAGQHGSYEIVPLDDVRPSGPPWPREGLVAYLPALDVNGAAPGTRVVNDAASASGRVNNITDGRQGAGISFDGASSTGRNALVCGSRVCGPDGAGGSCGTCPTGTTCDTFAGTCYEPNNCTGNSCTYNGRDMSCGTDGCGRTCGFLGGACESGSACGIADGECYTNVTQAAVCGTRECGPTMYAGISCGTCDAGELCNGDGRCVSGVSGQGVVRIIPDVLVPRDGSAARHEQGGATLAFWARVPEGSLASVNPLASTRTTSGGEVCAWTRPTQAVASVSCPSGSRIVAIDAYWGAADVVPGPDGTCDSYRRIRRTPACSSPVAATNASACIGQPSCTLDYSLNSDPCAADPQARSVLTMRAICDIGQGASSTLYVGDAAEGNHLRLTLPDAPDVVSGRRFEAGSWHHVALVHERRARGLGTITLWVDGQQEANARSVVFPDVYEWDLGAGYFRDFPRVPNAINTDAKITNADGSFRSSKPWNVAGSGDVDDVFLYHRALSNTEIGALYRKPDSAALRVWPAVDAERALSSTGWVGPAATTTPMEAIALLDRTKSTTSNPVRIASEESALRLPAGTEFVAGDAAPDLASLSTFTLAGWVRPSTLTAGTRLLELSEGTQPQVVLSLASGCSASAATAALLGTSLNVSSACAHGLAAGEWAFVAYVQDGTTQSVYVDGVLTASGTAPQAIFTGTGSRSLRAGNGVDLGWATIFSTAYTAEKLEAFRSQGPAVWVEGSIALDLAAFHNNVSGSAMDRAVLWSSSNGTATAGSGAAVTVPARGRFRPLGTTTERAFSWSGQVGLPSSVGTAALTVPLFQLDQPGSQLASASLRCGTSDTSGRVACRVLVGGVGSDGRFHQWSSDNRVALATALGGARVRVAVSFNRQPTAAMYMATATGDAVELSSEAGAALTMGEVGTPGTAPTSTATTHQFVLPARTPPTGITWSDLRLYARALSQLDLVALVSRGCAAQNCGTQARTCISSGELPGAGGASVDVSVCGPCDDNSINHGGSCFTKARFNQVCAIDADCASNICGPASLCLQATADATCMNTCANLNRDCVQVTGTTAYTCSNSCHAAAAVRANGPVCDWLPYRQPGEACSDDYDCVTKKCVTTSRPKYSVSNQMPNQSCPLGVRPHTELFEDTNDCCMPILWNSSTGALSYDKDPSLCAVPDATANRTVSICAGFDRLACESTNRDPLPMTANVPGYGSMSVYNCGGCKEGYREQWTMLSPTACQTMFKNYYALGDYKNQNYQGKWELEDAPTLVTLRRLLLQDSEPTSKITPRIYANLDVAGAGPVLLNWEKLPYSAKAPYTNYSWPHDEPYLSDCNKETYEEENSYNYVWDYPSAFFDPSLNYALCVAKRWPNGTLCPQPGVTLDRAHAGQNCLSGFCAADTSACEEGGFEFEETQGAARNDANKGETPDNDIGGIGLTQKTYSYARVTPSSDPNVTDKRTYGLGFGGSYTANVFGLLQYDVLDVNVALAAEKEAETGTYDQSVEVFGLDVPIPPPDRPEAVAKVTRPLAGCDAAVWENGEWKKPDCEVAKDEDGQPKIAEIEPIEITIPLPIGECEDWGKGSAAVATSGVRQKGKLCFKETTVVGFVPITVTAQVTINVLLEFGAIIDPDDLSPAFLVTPGLALGLDVHGGVGIQEFVTVYAGVYASIEIVGIRFPISWTLKAEEISDKSNHRIDGLYAVKFKRDVDLVLSFLKMELGIFLELGIGPFTHEWTWDLLGFEGIRLSWKLKSDTLSSSKVDFEWQP